MKKIMIDMDDVIISGGLIHLLNEFMHTDYKEEEFNKFYIQDIISNKKEFFSFFFSKNLYDYGVLKDGVVESIKNYQKLMKFIFVLPIYMRMKKRVVVSY